MISEMLATVAQVGILAFVVTSMLGLGMSLNMNQIIDPLRNVRLLAIILAANFVAVPLIAWILGEALPLDTPAQTALILLGAMAGAPFLPKLAQMSKGDVPLSVGTMVLLMVVTIGYAPLVVPLILDGVDIAAWDIAKSLIFLMLLPLGLALLFNARYPDTAAGWAPDLSRISSISLVIAISAGVLVAWEDIIDSVGSWIFIGTIILAASSLIIGWLATIGSDGGIRSTIGLGTAQRNLSAALLVAGTNFDTDTMVMTLVASLALSVVLILSAGEIGKLAPGESAAPEGAGQATT